MSENSPAPQISEDRAYAALSYLWVLSLVPLFFKRQSAYVQFHAKQGFLLFVAEVVIGVVAVIPVLGWIIGFLGWLAAVVLSVLGIIAALTGKEWVMPVLGEYAKKWNF